MHNPLAEQISHPRDGAVEALMARIAQETESSGRRRSVPSIPPEALLNLVAAPVLLCEPVDMRIVCANQSACSLLDHSRSDLRGRKLAEFLRFGDRAERLARFAHSSRDHVLRFERLSAQCDGREVEINARFAPVPTASGKRLIAATLDAHHPESQDTAPTAEDRDELTGLATRRALRRHLTTLLQRHRYDNQPFAVLFVDLDGFKRVNDSFGHHAGDRVLACVADRLLECRRPGDLVARYGGDEFVIVIAGIGGSKETNHIVRRIRQAMKRPILYGNVEFTIGVSVGASLCNGPDDAVDSLIHRADAAMYRVKRSCPVQLHGTEAMPSLNGRTTPVPRT